MLDFLKPLIAAPSSAPRTSLDGTRLVLDGGITPIPVDIRVNPRARRMVLRIDRRSGAAALTLPRGIGRVRAERFLTAHIGWLEARLKALPQRIPFAPGALVPLRGVPHRLVHRAPFRGVTRAVMEEGEARLIIHGDEAQMEARVLRFLKQEALADLTRAAAHHAGKLGVTYSRISVKDTRSRWGSCSSRGDLSFSWRLILAPPFILEYLVVHELAHRLEMNHSSRYWRHVAAIMPDFECAEAWLRREGCVLHHYG